MEAFLGNGAREEWHKIWTKRSLVALVNIAFPAAALFVRE
jgi:hypothetical protein